MGNCPGCAGGSNLITGTLKSRNLSSWTQTDAGKWEAGEPWQNRKSERFKASVRGTGFEFAGLKMEVQSDGECRNLKELREVPD